MADNETDKAMKEMLGVADESQKAAEETVQKAEKVVDKADTEAPASETTQEEPAKESAETDWKAEARKWESRSKENKEKADKFDEVSAKVSELETKVSELTETHKAELDKSALEIMRWKVAAKYGVSEEDVELFLNATDEETLVKQAERLAQTSTHAPKPDFAQGKRTETGTLSKAQQGAAALEGLFN